MHAMGRPNFIYIPCRFAFTICEPSGLWILTQLLRADSPPKSREDGIERGFLKVMLRYDGPPSTADAFSADNTVNSDFLPIHNHTSQLVGLPVIRDRAVMTDIYAQGLCMLIHHTDKAASIDEVPLLSGKIIEWSRINILARGSPGVDMRDIADKSL